MKSNESEILESKIGKNDGFIVPDGYFDEFARKMAQKLPEKQFAEEAPRTLWAQIRPYAYLAAMFAGIWCTMYVFTSLRGDSRGLNPAIAEAFNNEHFVDDFILYGDFNEYTLMQEMMDDSVVLTTDDMPEFYEDDITTTETETTLQ